MASRIEACPCCGSDQLQQFFTAKDVPVNSCLSLRTREEALAFPTGEIALSHCRKCAFVFNAAFDERLLEYSERYDPTQAFSGTFTRWHQGLAERLVTRYELHNRNIIEIGCGKGEFLSMLCSMGPNRGVGFDPAYDPERAPEVRAGGTAEFVADFYSEKYANYTADFVCCKMTLEHITRAHEFVAQVHRAVQASDDPVVFFQVPDVRRILQEQAFWDIYYEHCSYYSAGSLARLFRRAGFSVVALAREYSDQYLMIDTRITASADREQQAEHDTSEIASLVDLFAKELPDQLRTWRTRISGMHERGKRVVIWGAGSKGVSFLTTLGLRDEVAYAVDINPHRAGLFMAGTGQEIVSPNALTELRPDVVIIMNPMYREEIETQLSELGLQPEVMTT
ncbi:MAG: class I SAM-dependent methyltransferase [Myxococcales bacterium]|nr:class I SAM-dependent methyltransferase [Myxococcales bacterium]MDD9966931.1 class I SAM-dependent methyltransferase [Myxococcales bacterium]